MTDTDVWVAALSVLGTVTGMVAGVMLAQGGRETPGQLRSWSADSPQEKAWQLARKRERQAGYGALAASGLSTIAAVLVGIFL